MEYTKVCFKCEIEQPITEFYKHAQMEDGHLNKCKNCTKKDTKEREKILRSNPEWVEKEKKRNKEKDSAIVRIAKSPVLFRQSVCSFFAALFFAGALG